MKKGMKLSDKAKGLTKELSEMLMNPDVMAEGLSTVCLWGSDDDNRPIDRWSIRNRLLAWAAGTCEARTFNQWKKMGVKVNKGCSAFYILAPILITPKDEKDKEKGKKILIGYRVIPEFKVEDTNFVDQMPEWQPPEPPSLAQIADVWNLTVRYVPRNTVANAAGYTDGASRITLCTHDERVFYHELMHVADFKANGKPSKITNPRPLDEVEAIAEMGAAIIARMFGQEFTDKTYKYVSQFTSDPEKLVLKVLPKLEKALKLVMAEAEKLVAIGAVSPF